MFNRIASACFRLGREPCFRIYGKARREAAWRIIDIHATHRRDQDSFWPPYFWRGTCITWTASVIAVGWDFAEEVLREQVTAPASREQPVVVLSGRLRDGLRRQEAGAPALAWASEVLAHECGHTGQAIRLGLLYWPIGGAFTLCREGPHLWNWFENQASEEGQFGGLVNDSVCPRLQAYLQSRPRPE
jgi:hypothetical protein